MSSIAERVASRFVQAGIKEITKVVIRKYTDNGQTKAIVSWVDGKGKKGTTEGDPKNGHMKALMDRAGREGVKIEREKWASGPDSFTVTDAKFNDLVRVVYDVTRKG